MNHLKIATLNLCLGLKNKKDLVKAILLENEIDVLQMQETELEKDFDSKVLKIPGYVLELEVNQDKKRVGVYIKDNLKYLRRTDLEGENSHIIVIDIECKTTITKRLINLYRSFNPIGYSA